MKVAYVGNFSFPHCTEVHLSRTLEAMGHTVARLQENQQTLRDIEYVASDSDLLIYTRTWGLPSKATALWRRLEKRGVPTISYHLDLWRGIARQAEVKRQIPFWTTGWVFSPDGDPESQEWFDAHGIRHRWIRPGVYDAECRRGKRRAEYARRPVAFVGSYDYHDEWPYRRELIDWLEATYPRWFRRYGPGAQTVRGQRLNNLYASASVIVGDCLCPGFTKPRYWSDRVYETLGRGGFLIHPYIEGLEQDFENGEHLVFYEFGQWDQLRDLIDFYVKDRAAGREIADRGQAHVIANHTYRHRLEETLGILRAEGALTA